MSHYSHLTTNFSSGMIVVDWKQLFLLNQSRSEIQGRDHPVHRLASDCQPQRSSTSVRSSKSVPLGMPHGAIHGPCAMKSHILLIYSWSHQQPLTSPESVCRSYQHCFADADRISITRRHLTILRLNLFFFCFQCLWNKKHKTGSKKYEADVLAVQVGRKYYFSISAWENLVRYWNLAVTHCT